MIVKRSTQVEQNKSRNAQHNGRVKKPWNEFVRPPCRGGDQRRQSYRCTPCDWMNQHSLATTITVSRDLLRVCQVRSAHSTRDSPCGAPIRVVAGRFRRSSCSSVSRTVDSARNDAGIGPAGTKKPCRIVKRTQLSRRLPGVCSCRVAHVAVARIEALLITSGYRQRFQAIPPSVRIARLRKL